LAAFRRGELDGFGQQAFIIALQEQEGLGVAGDDLDQPSSGVDLQVWAVHGFAHEEKRCLQFPGVGFEALSVQGVTLGQVLAQSSGGPLAEVGCSQGIDAITN